MTTTNPTTTTKTVPAKTVIEDKRLRDTDNPSLWTVISIKDCPWAKKTVDLLKEHGEEVKEVAMTREWHRKLIVEYDCRRSPAVFRGAGYFGTYGNVENYYKCSFYTDNEIF
jgi:glutaredoxin